MFIIDVFLSYEQIVYKLSLGWLNHINVSQLFVQRFCNFLKPRYMSMEVQMKYLDRDLIPREITGLCASISNEHVAFRSGETFHNSKFLQIDIYAYVTFYRITCLLFKNGIYEAFGTY